MRSRPIAAMLAATTAALASVAHAEPAPLQGVVSLSASATVEVTKDLLNVVLSTNKEGQDAATVQSQLKQALDAALAEARKAAKPGQVEVRTGGFSLGPRYSTKANGISGWVGSAELVLEGRDVAALSQLAGRIQTLTIARVGYTLSREAREKVEGEVTAQAIARFRAQAESYARQFGFGGYSLREVSVNTGNDDGPRPGMAFRAQAAPASGNDMPLPTEAGKANVTATVNGSVQLTLR